MNLWAKRIGQLAMMLAVALFFLSCQEDTSVLGYRNPNSKFKVSYVEIPIESSVLLLDSVRTSNYTYFGEPNRLLVGTYVDETFGNVSALAATTFFTTTTTKVGSSAVFDSVTLQLQFDLYNYGALTTTPQTISIYELDKELKSDSLREYFNKSSAPHSLMLGSKTFSINPADFNKFAASSTDKDTVITIKMPLDKSFGNRLFNSAYQYATVASDTTYVTYTKFIQQFKGIVIRPETGDKILGISSLGAATKITLHYHETDKPNLSISLGFGSVVGFNQIKSDRSGSELSGLTQYHQESLQSNNNRYIHSGVGVVTKLDFSKFYEFADTVPYVLINSAELVIDGVQASSYAPPATLSLRILKDNNRMRTFSRLRPQDITDLTLYNQLVKYDFAISQSSAALAENDSVFYATGDRSPLIAYSSSTNSYRAVMSLFFQQLTLPNENKTRFRDFVLYPAAQSTSTPAAQSFAKSVNRAVFPKDQIKLKIFYTKPNTPN